jgi:hypothetical protein
MGKGRREDKALLTESGWRGVQAFASGGAPSINRCSGRGARRPAAGARTLTAARPAAAAAGSQRNRRGGAVRARSAVRAGVRRREAAAAAGVAQHLEAGGLELRDDAPHL